MNSFQRVHMELTTPCGHPATCHPGTLSTRPPAAPHPLLTQLHHHPKLLPPLQATTEPELDQKDITQTPTILETTDCPWNAAPRHPTMDWTITTGETAMDVTIMNLPELRPWPALFKLRPGVDQGLLPHLLPQLRPPMQLCWRLPKRPECPWVLWILPIQWVPWTRF